MHYINESNPEKVKAEIRNIKKNNQTRITPKEENRIIVVQAKNDTFNRAMLEYGQFDILLGIEEGDRKNKIRQSDSGLNRVLAKIAVKNNIAIGFDHQKIREHEKIKKAETLVKLKQNIEIVKKMKTKIAVKTKDSRAAIALLTTLGASSSQTKETLSF
jgi:RNase P/RNase MRP subunit p30